MTEERGGPRRLPCTPGSPPGEARTLGRACQPPPHPARRTPGQRHGACSLSKAPALLRSLRPETDSRRGKQKDTSPSPTLDGHPSPRPSLHSPWVLTAALPVSSFPHPENEELGPGDLPGFSQVPDHFPQLEGAEQPRASSLLLRQKAVPTGSLFSGGDDTLL